MMSFSLMITLDYNRGKQEIIQDEELFVIVASIITLSSVQLSAGADHLALPTPRSPPPSSLKPAMAPMTLQIECFQGLL